VFSRFQSPQWVVWITPLALLAAKGGREIALLVAQDVLAYAYFPLAYHRFGPTAPSLAFTLGLLTAVRLILLVSLLWPPSDEPAETSDRSPTRLVT
jgi:Ni/Fe-hydrogenase subunit HybB-like protein